MDAYLRILAREVSSDCDQGIKEKITAFVNAAPGIKAVKRVDAHVRGGFSVMVDRDDVLPESFATHFEAGEFMLVI